MANKGCDKLGDGWELVLSGFKHIFLLYVCVK